MVLEIKPELSKCKASALPAVLSGPKTFAYCHDVSFCFEHFTGNNLHKIAIVFVFVIVFVTVFVR